MTSNLSTAGDQIAATLRRATIKREPTPFASAGGDLIADLRRAASQRRIQALLIEYRPLVERHRARAAAHLRDDDKRQQRAAAMFGFARQSVVL